MTGFMDRIRGNGQPRRRPVSARVEEAKEKEVLAVSNAKVQVINALMSSRPDLLALALFPRLAKLMPAAAPASTGGNDQLQALLMKKLESDIMANPIDQLVKLQQASRAYRELQEELSPDPHVAPAPDGAAGVVASILDSAFNSPFGAQLGAVIGQAMMPRPGQPGAIAGGAPQGIPTEAAAAAFSIAAPAALPESSPTPAAAPAMDPPSPLLLRALMAMFRNKPPQAMAALLMDKADGHQDLSDLLEMVINTADEDLQLMLGSWLDLPGWGQVSEWLLANPEYCTALVVELRRLASEETEEDTES